MGGAWGDGLFTGLQNYGFTNRRFRLPIGVHYQKVVGRQPENGLSIANGVGC
ncbi:hypothetical protein GCWU000324_01712 [Kingella oralis ATCC 51147]|uniref:Uncharacterized protein n=1 Tax=Kingella oralis ATCC 51147 TaxID=629741 RepID=C4GL57_9NEIS|nr:hypothetical protein GCWU000324_01712 [Kingella oralis ATCC 51147]